ncbi:hypothetical protein MNEG_16023, partial [Monoraphidium neglectum]
MPPPGGKAARFLRAHPISAADAARGARLLEENRARAGGGEEDLLRPLLPEHLLPAALPRAKAGAAPLAAAPMFASPQECPAWGAGERALARNGPAVFAFCSLKRAVGVAKQRALSDAYAQGVADLKAHMAQVHAAKTAAQKEAAAAGPALGRSSRGAGLLGFGAGAAGISAFEEEEIMKAFEAERVLRRITSLPDQ